MSWYAQTDHRYLGRVRSIRRGAVPLGQHSHSPEAVLGTTPLQVRVVPGVIHQPPPPRPPEPPTGLYPDLAAPAPRDVGCARCERTAALVDPATQRGYCADCWIEVIVKGQIE